jgi:hypothetical protein
MIACGLRRFFTKRKREEEKSEMVSWIISTKEKKRKVKW